MTTATKANRKSLRHLLGQVLPKTSILETEEQTRPYECDGLTAYQQKPWLVVLPETIAQVQNILSLCHDEGVPVVARGAGTGLSGGALPLANGVLLSLAKFNRILDINPANRSATVEPGVRNLAISQAAEEFNLYYAPDPSSQIACTIGGNVAENAGGVHCLKYGLTVHNILQLKVITIDGDLITIGSQALDTPGYDLLALMTGSEGMLGVIVEVTVKLLPRPEQAQVILAAFDDVVKAGESVGAIIAEGIIPAGLEMMDNPAIRAAEDYAQAGYPVDAEAILLCELDGTHEEVSEQIKFVEKLLTDKGATSLRTSKNE
ncbi:MAG: FAD-binding protein, partial [Gammaproteobacteria bacterium]|nr:FAD-binding protein [Gammaproteobacteria bacterium]